MILIRFELAAPIRSFFFCFQVDSTVSLVGGLDASSIMSYVVTLIDGCSNMD